MKEIVIRLEGQLRKDGSVFIRCPELPLFNVVGQNEKEALDNAIAILPRFLEYRFGAANEIRTASSLHEGGESDNGSLLPAHVIASVGDNSNGRGSKTSR